MKNKLMRIMLLAAALLCTLSVWAQTNVRGRVTDVAGNPLIGVTVLVKGSHTGATTDMKGNYSIQAAKGQTLVYSFIGYTSVEESVGSRSVIDVKLEEQATEIGSVEVVSVGYGTMARRDLTGSVAKANMGEIMKAHVTTFDQALTGRVAGVVVRTSDGELGKEASITIRGNNSLTQSNSPLYIIDGFPMESSTATLLNSNDIESIDFLKDASATAIYGARGANGVIVITTKKGREGRPTVAFNASFTLDKLSNKIDLMKPYEFVRLQSDLATASGTDLSKTYFADGRDLEYYRTVKGYDWQDEVYRTAFTQSYDVSVSGGVKNGTIYNVGFSALDQDGILINSAFQRYQGKINLTQPISKKIKLNLTANYSHTATNGVSPTTANTSSSQSGWLIYSIWGYRPVGSSPTDDLIGDLTDYDAANSNDYRFNPLLTARNEVRKTYVDYLNAKLGLTYQITPELTFKTTGGYTLNKRRREEFNGSKTYTGYSGSPSGKGINGSIYWYNTRNWLNENTLTYKKQFAKKHNLEAMVGLSMQGENYSYDGISATQLTTERLGVAGLYTGNQQTVQPYYYKWRMMSYYARLNYNYKYKYYLTATMRADGSSKFPTDNQWGYFPSVGASWNFNRENWLKNSTWLSNGKLRASWGQTGNNRTTTPYDFYAQITTTPGASNSFDYVFNNNIISGYYVSQMANQRLKWETTAQYNVGTDLGFFQDRIKLTVDWYRKVTSDLLLSATMPASSGYTSAMMNIGKLRNRGWEFSLETVNIRKRNFQWTTSFNIAINRNQILALVDGQKSLLRTVSWDQQFNSQYPYISQVGKPTGMMFGLIYEGTYKADDFDANGLLKDGIPYLTTYAQSSIKAGDPKYRDMNGDGKVDDNDRTIIGSGQPLHTGGFGNNFVWKNFDLNIFFTWSYGNDILNANRLAFELGKKKQTNQLASYANRWSADNPNSNIPRADANGMYVYSSRVVEDGSFLRLSNISLGYTLPDPICKKMRMSSMRVYMSLNNIHTFTSYSGPDPEVSTRNSVLTPGFDWSAYPRTFGVTAGVELTF